MSPKNWHLYAPPRRAYEVHSKERKWVGTDWGLGEAGGIHGWCGWSTGKGRAVA